MLQHYHLATTKSVYFWLAGEYARGVWSYQVIKHLSGELEESESSKGPTFLANLEPLEPASQQFDL